MHKPTVGAEWSSEMTTIRPFDIFLRVVGGRHSWVWAGRVTERKNNKSSKRRVMVIGVPRDMDSNEEYCSASSPFDAQTGASLAGRVRIPKEFPQFSELIGSRKWIETCFPYFLVRIKPQRIIAGLTHLAGHDEEGLHLKAGIAGPEALGVVMLFHVNDFFRGDDRIDGHVVVAAILKDDETSIDFIEDEVQGE